MNSKAKTLVYAIPVAPNNDVLLEGPFPVSEAQWEHFMKVLDVMKPGLVIPRPGDEETIEVEGP